MIIFTNQHLEHSIVMNSNFEHLRKVSFSETDLAGIVHFASFFPYMEDCEHEFYRSLGLSVTNMRDYDGEKLGWPRVHASCNYKKPLHFDEEFKIRLKIVKISTKTIEYNFRFISQDEEMEFAEGTLIVACVKFGESGMASVKIPDKIKSLLPSTN